MKKYFKVGIVCGIAIIILVSLVFIPITRNVETASGNPASKYCIEHGGLSAIESTNNGTQQAICTFPNGSVCDEMKYYKGECSPAS